MLGFEPEDDGPHWLLRVRKRGWNTLDVARWLGGQAGVRARDVGVCGLKDRHAVTTQYFSVPVVAGGAPPVDWAWSDAIGLVQVRRNRRKLRRGAHRGNRFTLVLRELEGDVEDIGPRVARVRDGGFPNYFGEQRFGRDGGNPAAARERLAGGRMRRGRGGIEVSALRALLFNRVLASRVADASWNRDLSDDLMILDGSGSYFRVEPGDASVRERLDRLDIHPSGPLWGVRKADFPGALEARELTALGELRGDAELLERAGLDMARRALRGAAPDLAWRALGPDAVELSFSLGRGAFATALLRELVEVAAAPIDASGGK